MDRTLVRLALIALLAAVVLGCLPVKPRGRVAPPTPAGSVPPSDGILTACGFDGLKAAVVGAKGKVVLVDCWATWCAPCVRSFPELVEKHHKYAGRGLAVVSMSLDDADGRSAVEKFLKEHDAKFTNLQLVDEEDRPALRDYLGFRGSIPHAALFDRQGHRVWAGHPASQELDSKLAAELDR